VGHKVHPTGFRIGVIYDWQSKWYADRGYVALLHEDLDIRRFIARNLTDAGVSRVEIDRNANQVIVTMYTSKPGIVIGRGGSKVDELRSQLEALTRRRVRVNIQEIRQPELDAFLVARSIADQLERRVAFRRAMKQAINRTMQRGAQGIKVIVAGRLGGTEMSRRETEKDGRVPLHTIRADIDYGQAEARTTFGRIGVKAWIYKGDVLPEAKEAPEEEPVMPAAEGPAPAPEVPASADEPATQAEQPEQPAPAPEPKAQEPKE
jgi:small subunit ribosomal protein S3